MGEFGDAPVQRLLLRGRAAGTHGDRHVDDAVVPVHTEVTAIAQRAVEAVVADQDLEVVVGRDAEGLDQGLVHGAAQRVEACRVGPQGVDADKGHVGDSPFPLSATPRRTPGRGSP